MTQSIAAPPTRRYADLGPLDPDAIPPLENGDRLTRAEFERRYHAMPENVKAELIGGVVYMASPVCARGHGRPHFQLAGWLSLYEAATPGVFGLDNTTCRLDDENQPQPDLALMIESDRGGQARLSGDDYVEGAPELIIEIASSSVGYALNQKLLRYQGGSVREYVVWRVRDRAIDWFKPRDDRYERLDADGDGLHRSEVFPGLWLDPLALLHNDLPRVFERLREGLASPEHAAFVARLNPPAGPAT